MKELWKEIKNYEDYYQISNKGRVKRIAGGMGGKVGRILKQLRHKNGYLSITLCKNCKPKYHSVHRLVALAFIKNDNQLRTTVNHKDGDKANNIVSNLEWNTYSENHLHSFKYLGRKNGMSMKGKFGKDHNRSKSFRLFFPDGSSKIFGSGLEARRELGVDHTSISYGLKMAKDKKYFFKRGKLKGYSVSKK